MAKEPGFIQARLLDIQRTLFSVSGQDRAVFLRCMATMLGSGISIDRSLALLAEQSTNRELQLAGQGMSRLISGGSYLSAAMSRFPWVFTPLQRRLVQVGERSGSLVHVLNRLATYEEKQVALALKVRSSMTMPILVCILCIALVVIIPPFLFQGLFKMLQDTSTALPWPTKLLMSFSNLLRSWFFYVLFIGSLFGLAAGYTKTVRDPKWRLRFHDILLSVPGLGPTFRLIGVTRFLNSLDTMVRVGLPIMTCMELSAGASDNAVLQEKIKKAIEGVKEGLEINEALKATEFFPIAVIHSVQVGEQSGRLADMLESLSRIYEVELDTSFEAMAKSIEPFVLSVIGAVVGFTVIATMMPMVKLIQNL